ncbi:reverse transcriptase domain-containing protein [Tanacetum coccineum]
MPFGLKNARATYQRLVDKAFQKQISRNLEVYVDDLVIKSRTKQEVIKDLEKTFKTLREINIKLNPIKCAFGMREGTFLGYKVNADGLRVCPDKVEAVLNLPSPKCLKDVQRLNGKLASLNRFLSKLAEKSLPIFKTLKTCTKKSDVQWTTEAEMAFKKMKKLIAELPMLTAPKEKEEPIIYLASAKEAISAVLMTERDGKQMVIYFVSRALQGPKINYTPMEKLILALLEEHDIHYRPRTLVKGQILADFIMERSEDDPQDTLMEDKEELLDPWILFTDGSSCKDGPRSRPNNYKSKRSGIHICSKESGMIIYLEKVKTLTGTFKEFSIKQVPRGENKRANALSKMASTSFAHLSKQVLVEELKEKSIDEKEVLAVVEEEGRTWMTLIYEYFTEEILPEEKRNARAIRRKAGPGKVNFLIVAVDYFTKWIEAKLVATITRAQIKKFVCDNIVCRFSLPGEIIPTTESSSGTTLSNIGVKSYVSANALLLLNIRKPMACNGETPFSLTYGTKAVILVEIGMPTLRTAEVNIVKNDEALEINLDLLEEKREQTAIQEAKKQG